MDDKKLKFYCGFIQTTSNTAMIHVRKEDSDKISAYGQSTPMKKGVLLTRDILLTEMASISAYLAYNDILSNKPTENDSEGNIYIVITYIDNLNNIIAKLVDCEIYANILNDIQETKSVYVSSYSLGKRYEVNNNHNIMHAKFENIEKNGSLTFNIEDYLKSNEIVICELEFIDDNRQ